MMNDATGTTRNLPKRTHLASEGGPYAACNGRSTDRFYLTMDNAAVTCARCLKLVASC